MRKSAFRLSGTPITHGRTPPAAQEPPPLPDYDDLGTLPEAYGEPILYLVARDPEWFFAYWELPELSTEEALANEATTLELRIYVARGEAVELLEAIVLNAEARNWYLPIPEQAVGVCCYGEIGYQRPGGEWLVAARSCRTSVPPRGLSGSCEEQFATIPFHLAFQQLVGLLHEEPAEATAPEEPLTVALSRLQGEGRGLAAALRMMPCWDDEQRRLLSVLLGHDAAAFEGRDQGEIDALLREELQARLSSTATSGSSVWPSASWLGDAMAYLVKAGGGSDSLMSWARHTASSEALASWPGGQRHTAEGGYWQEWLSSWGGASGGDSSGLHSSGSHGSSWSAQAFSAKPARDFFLHVNAEVIFYGGTHPEAAVEINGQPVALQPDGTFRHHFRFPDGAGSVPIVARAPDGREERGVMLRFARGTDRSGPSDHTAQPEELPDPLWR